MSPDFKQVLCLKSQHQDYIAVDGEEAYIEHYCIHIDLQSDAKHSQTAWYDSS